MKNQKYCSVLFPVLVLLNFAVQASNKDVPTKSLDTLYSMHPDIDVINDALERGADLNAKKEGHNESYFEKAFSNYLKSKGKITTFKKTDNLMPKTQSEGLENRLAQTIEDDPAKILITMLEKSHHVPVNKDYLKKLLNHSEVILYPHHHGVYNLLTLPELLNYEKIAQALIEKLPMSDDVDIRTAYHGLDKAYDALYKQRYLDESSTRSVLNRLDRVHHYMKKAYPYDAAEMYSNQYSDEME